MRDKLQKVWHLFLLFDSVKASVNRQSVKRCDENWERPYPKDPTKEDLPQRPLGRFGSFRLCRVPRVAWIAFFFVMMLAIPTINRAHTQQQTRLTGSEPVPEPAVPAILAAFDKYEVVAVPQGHGMQDLNDFILSLIRNPAFSEKVNDIEVEFGNSLYQPILDRYIAGENVPFTEVQKVWRKDGQPAPGASAFVEQFFPLVRALNQKRPPERRLRVLAGDPSVDWDQIKSIDDVIRHVHRDASIASVMEKEVLSKHRKAVPWIWGTLSLQRFASTRRTARYITSSPKCSRNRWKT